MEIEVSISSLAEQFMQLGEELKLRVSAEMTFLPPSTDYEG